MQIIRNCILIKNELKMKKIFVALVLLAGFSASAQIKIGANPTSLNDGSLLELESSTKGLKFPEVALTSTSEWLPLAGTKVMGMTVYNTATAGDVTPGLYTNNGTAWVKNEAASTAPVLKIRVETSAVTVDFSGGEDIFIITKVLSAFKLPSASLFKNRVLYIRNESPNTVTYSGAKDIDGPVGIISISATAAQMLISDGTVWHMISGKI
jgi:hypothetical protein